MLAGPPTLPDSTMLNLALACLAAPLAPAAGLPVQADAQWTTRRLDVQFRAGGCAFGDIDGDGQLDFLAGGAWYRGPEFVESHVIQAQRTWDPAQYSDHFFDFVEDLDGDARNDVLVVGFPGQAAHW